MKIKIDAKMTEEWLQALRGAGSREIGGVLFGEHVAEAEFRIVEATHQFHGGNTVSFRRSAAVARRKLKKLSGDYDNNYQRFNYLGEWHSHPNAPVIPSGVDELSMREILEDPDTEANFLVLIIVRLDDENKLEISATSYLASGHILECEISFENYGD
jgi:integrative and conjugative element protein (TIGR02256 family)